MRDPDRLIQRVISELRRPVDVDPNAKARVIDEVRRIGRRGPIAGGRAFLLQGRRRYLAAATTAAVAAAALLAVVLVRSRPGDGESRVAQAVQFVYVGRDASRVYLVGDFNDWEPSATPLQRSVAGAGAVWSVTLSLAPGQYRYAFIVDDGRWVADEAAPRAPEDEFGVQNSILIVEDRST
ncbi:MAG: isoamylase early set domain-containing protein [Gemmatimonadales bacterium]|jgi:hypothetical protein